MDSDKHVTKPRDEKTIGARAPRVTRSVFWPSVVLLLGLVGLALLFPDQLSNTSSKISNTLVNASGWYYVLVVAFFFVFILAVAFSRKGEIVLGKDEDEPEYSTASWFAMLFSAGMGIGLVFFGAAEPLIHFTSPHPGVDGVVADRAKDAMATTFLHWGISAWAIYAVMGLGIAYAVHRKGLPVSIRWALQSLLGKHTNGLLGTVIDIVAIIGTTLGVATSLGFGVAQLSSGVEVVFGITVSRGLMIGMALTISGLAAISVSTGLDRGIKLLSNSNMILAVVLALTVFILGPTLFIANEFVQDLGYYIQNFISLSLRTLPFEGAAGSAWMSSWTVYYWAWWISWSPFVGIFIARISRGRTIREFIVGVVLVPTLITFVWFAIFGGTALYQQIFGPGDLVGADGIINSSTLLFSMFSNMPGSKILSFVAMILLVVFFVTSSDSGSYVMSMISSGGNANPSTKTRLTWAAFTGIITASLLASGSDPSAGLGALQTLVISAALPMTFILIAMCVSLWRDLTSEQEITLKRERRLLRSKLVDDVVEQVSSQMDDSVISTSVTNPIETAGISYGWFAQLNKTQAEYERKKKLEAQAQRERARRMKKAAEREERERRRKLELKKKEEARNRAHNKNSTTPPKNEDK